MAREAQREQTRGQSGAGIAAEHVRLFGADLSPTVRRFRHVRFAWQCHQWAPALSPKAEAEHLVNECRLRELAAELIAGGVQ